MSGREISMDLSTTADERVVLDSTNLPRIFTKLHRMLYKDKKDTWHMFRILNGSSYEKEVILRILMDYADPLVFIPVLYKEEGPDSCFLACNCRAAIEKLIIRSGLALEIPNGPSLQLQIVLGYAPITELRLNMQDILIKVIEKRFDANKKHLNLSNYHKDTDLYDIIFCPLSRQRILQYVINTVRSALPFVKSINLSHNELNSLKAFQLGHSPSLVRLDLRHNKIAHLIDLENLQSLKLQEVLLDQNPLCDGYHDELAYINDIRAVLPTIQKLDGVVLGPPGLPRIKRNFLTKPENYNLADQFVRYYFTTYDGEDRSNLKGLYHINASFSLTSTYLPAQSTSNTARLTEYTMESRNLLKLSDYSKNLKLLYHGPDDILATISKLPRSEHDPFSFTVDLVESDYGVVITVCGVFREPTMIKSPLIRSFCRVFVLVKVGHRQFQIINEMVHIKNATTKEVQTSFRRLQSMNPVGLTESDREQMAEIFSKITEMNIRWSTKCLEESKWNITDALTVFTELYKSSKIPPEAFLK
ncbi:nuclear RNA export factor 1-like [Periplaneta americana]|uniref:nuclear RNA export factor 1-like n=1 Tax=Periplaneta americana TaxID=6978 RepID=UPI0037E98A64